MKYSILGFLLLLVGTIGIASNGIYAEIDDLDKDKVPNNIDKCPNLKEDNEGVIDGCPSNFGPWYDQDYDGIQDHIDQCPDLKENYNKFKDNDGCPDSVVVFDSSRLTDTDGDGFNDYSDHCPNQPETFNQILDDDGCPDDYISPIDRDRDGFPDMIDACPQYSETFNRFQDDDGCPDKIPEFILDSDGTTSAVEFCLWMLLI